MKGSTKEHWEDYWQSKNHQPQVIHTDLINNLVKITAIKNKKILEIGAGMGGDSLYLAEKGARVTVLDFSREAIENIKKSSVREGVNIETVLADAKETPFKDESYDIVFHQGFLEHFADTRPYLLEQRRIIKKGGLLVVDVPQRYTTYTIKKHWLMWRKKWFAGWEKEFSINELERLLKENKFLVLKSYGWGYYGKLHWLRSLKLGKCYQRLWGFIEKSKIKLYLNFSIGVIAQKK
jgi:ubiquinone/menaquinone biosynthesis C-methylase UbiE